MRINVRAHPLDGKQASCQIRTSFVHALCLGGFAAIIPVQTNWKTVLPARTTPKELAALAKELRADSRREAVASARGYDWQKWVAVERWIELEGDETLWIEFGEDITKATRAGVTTIQAKDLAAKISLGQAKVRDVISAAVVRGEKATTVVWTSAEAATEQGDPFGQPGIAHWAKVASGKAPVTELKKYLLSQSLSGEALKVLTATDDDTFKTIIGRVRFVIGEPKIEELRARVIASVEKRLPSAIGAASVLREDVADALFAHVAKVGARPKRENRVLNRPDLDHVALGLVDRVRRANAPEDLQMQMAVMERAFELSQEKHGSAWQQPPRDHELVTAAFDSELLRRLSRGLARSMFEEVASNEVVLLGAEVLSGIHDRASQAVRRDVLLRASRSASVHGELKDARDFLAAADALRGDVSRAPAAARLKAAEGDTDAAIRELRDASDADGFSTLLSVLHRAKGGQSAIAHYEAHEDPSLLTTNGYHTLVASFVQEGDDGRADQLLKSVSESALKEDPRLLFLRAIRAFATIFDKDARPTVLSGLPIDVRSLKPILPAERRAGILDQVISDFRRSADAATELELPRASALSTSYAVWAELLHPAHSSTALERLKRDIEAFLPSSMILVPFAFAFDATFDPGPLEARLEGRAALGGLDEEEFRAATAIAIHGKDAGRLLKFIDGNADALVASYGEPTVVNLKIQALVHAKDIEAARALLMARSSLLPDDLRDQLDAIVGTAEGDNPVERFRKLYEQTPTAESLRALLPRLAEAGLWQEFALRAEDLFGITQNPSDLADAARALARLRDDAGFLRILASNPDVVGLDEGFLAHSGWAHLRLGHFKEAKSVASALAATPKTRDLDLDTAIAIGSGEWESLPALLPVYLEFQQEHSGAALIRAARIAQIVGQGPLDELVLAAVEKAPDDAGVLVTAYSLVLEEGTEEDHPQAGDWMRRALELSGPDGPVHQVDLADMIARARKNMEIGQEISAAVMEGTLPLLAAAKGLGRSQAEVILGNLVRNSSMSDARRKTPVNLFSGVRRPYVQPARRLGLDVTALLTLHWLNLLSKLREGFDRVHISADMMHELFDAQRQLVERQKSQLMHASALQKAITSGRIQVLRASRRDAALDREVGAELADLIRAAEAGGGIVVRPPPVNKPGDLNREVDLSAKAAVLTDMHTILDAIVEAGTAPASKEERARRYFDAQAERWPQAAKVETGSTLYLDGLALTYLQGAGLLEPLLATFGTVFVHAENEREANATVAEQGVTSRIIEGITAIRSFFSQGLRNSFITLAPERSHAENLTGRPSSLNLIADLSELDAVVFDDRAINKDMFASDASKVRIPLITTLDLVEDLTARAVITSERRDECRMLLRRSGAVLIPIDGEELARAAKRIRAAPSQEFLAIKQSVNFVRAAELAVFPADIPWFAGNLMSLKQAIEEIWKDSTSIERKIELSRAVIALRLSPTEWEYAWRGSSVTDWTEVVLSGYYASLALVPAALPENLTPAYATWYDETILDPLRRQDPDRYKRLTDYIAKLLGTITKDDGGSNG